MSIENSESRIQKKQTCEGRRHHHCYFSLLAFRILDSDF
jgi:hypothetical protein